LTEPYLRAPIDVATIARRLAPVLGDEGADVAVCEAIQAQGYRPDSLERWQEDKILGWLAAKAGVVGMAARRARQNTDTVSQSVVRPVALVASPAPPRSVQDSGIIEGSELVAIFSRPLGEEKARETIQAACERLKLSFVRLPRESALMLLDELAATSGLVAVTARFAKARIALRK
jgi:hypothetical protein